MKRLHLSAAFTATVVALYAIITGLFVGIGSYGLFVLVFELFIMPLIVKHGEPSLSYGQQFAFLISPIAAMLGAGLGISTTFAMYGRRLISAITACTVAGWVAWVISRMWIGNHEDYGFDLSDWVLYVPLLIAAAVVFLTVAGWLVWKRRKLLQKADQSSNINTRDSSTWWLIFRVGLLITCFGGGLASFMWGPTAFRIHSLHFPLLEAIAFPLGMNLAIIAFFTMPFLMFGALWLQAASSTTQNWSSPRYFHNPLEPNNPLCFFHLAGLLLVAAGCGGFFSAIWSGYETLFRGAYAVLSGGLTLIGCYVLMRFCKEKNHNNDINSATTERQHGQSG